MKGPDAGARVRIAPRATYVMAAHGIRLAVAAAAAYPASGIAKKAIAAWPGGDRVLFDPGATMLVELVRLHRVGLESWVTQAALLTALTVPVAFLLNAVLLASLACAEKAPFARVAARAAGSLRPLAVAYVVYGAVTASEVGVFYLVVEAARGSGAEPGRDILAVAIGVVGALVVLATGVAHDVTRVAIVRGELDPAGALMATWRSVRAHGWGLAAAWWARSAAALALVVGEVWLFRSIGWLTTGAAVSAFVVHQGILLALLVLRFSWLARASELSATAVEAERRAMDVVRGGAGLKDAGSGTAVRTDGQGDPS